ncbi:MAG: polysaccharide deacetylase family protein [Bryobacteraceae bacterium]|nr:polysaccharide deacetylase family protein [Bryobacteraceae bacterium]
MNPTLKHFAEGALVRSGITRLARRARRGHTLVLAYHNVLPDGDTIAGDKNLHLPQKEFALQLDVVSETHEAVSIEAIGCVSPLSNRPRVVITFDDAYAGALTAGVEELEKRGMPATIFVAPALIDSVSWWDILAEQTDGAIAGDLRRHVLESLGGNADSVLRWADSTFTISRSNPNLPRIGNMAQLTAAASRPGVTIGSHSWSHPNLCALRDPDLGTELRRSDQWLRSQFSCVVPWLSYPYGLYNASVKRAIAKAGYRGAFRIDGGWVRSSASLPSYALPRLSIPSGLSLNGFRLRLAGL